MTTNEFFSLLLKMRRGEKVYIWTKSDETVLTDFCVNYSRNDLFINPFGDIITSNGTYVGNLHDLYIEIH